MRANAAVLREGRLDRAAERADLSQQSIAHIGRDVHRGLAADVERNIGAQRRYGRCGDRFAAQLLDLPEQIRIDLALSRRAGAFIGQQRRNLLPRRGADRFAAPNRRGLILRPRAQRHPRHKRCHPAGHAKKEHQGHDLAAEQPHFPSGC
jgi:hypothetical protein